MKVLKFGAVWCPGCIVMKPRWEEIEKENSWLETELYDFDQDKEMVEKYQINDELPTFVFLGKNGNELTRVSGELNKKKLEEMIAENKDK
ncbi:MAG: thioredoxin family protein [Patescibacteria group bacterium]|nr:thioredoxin family protein [Patescibacteria group bacterium]